MKEYEVIAPPPRITFGLTDEQMGIALEEYNEHHINRIMRETFGEGNLAEETTAALKVIMYKCINQGLLLAANPRDPVDIYWANRETTTAAQNVHTYEFEEGMGVCGLLKPDGTFLKCGNGEHHYLTEGVPFAEQFTYIYFSGVRRVKGRADPREDGDGIISTSPKYNDALEFKGVTPEQRAWMEEHFKYFDLGQKRSAWVCFDIGEDDEQ